MVKIQIVRTNLQIVQTNLQITEIYAVLLFRLLCYRDIDDFVDFQDFQDTLHLGIFYETKAMANQFLNYETQLNR